MKLSEENKAIFSAMVIFAVLIIFSLLVNQARSASVADYTGRVSVSHGDSSSHGSGVVVATQVGPILVTNYHVGMEPRGPTSVRMPDGRNYQATAIAGDKPHDLALFRLRNYRGRGIRYGWFTGKCKTYWMLGYGTSGKLRVCRGGESQTKYQPPADGKYEPVEFNFSAHSGDSGGPIVNEDGHVVGVVWGSTGNTSMATVGHPFVELLEAYVKRNQKQCVTGRCPPSMGQPMYKPPVFYQQPRVPRNNPPVAPPAPVPDIADSPPDNTELDELKKQVEDLRNIVDAIQPVPGPPGQPGPAGEPGQPGPPGQTPDIDIQGLADSIAASLPPITVNYLGEGGAVFSTEQVSLGGELNIDPMHVIRYINGIKSEAFIPVGGDLSLWDNFMLGGTQ